MISLNVLISCLARGYKAKGKGTPSSWNVKWPVGIYWAMYGAGKYQRNHHIRAQNNTDKTVTEHRHNTNKTLTEHRHKTNKNSNIPLATCNR